MTKYAHDDEDSLRDETPAPPEVSPPHSDFVSRDRQKLITKLAIEIAKRSACLNERLC